MKRNPHPDLVRAHLKRWRTRLRRALNEVLRLEQALNRAEAKRAQELRAQETAKRAERRAQIVQGLMAQKDWPWSKTLRGFVQNSNAWTKVTERKFRSEFTVRDEGSIYLLTPNTRKARAWARAHLPEDAAMWANAYVVEHRYIRDIVDGILQAGMEVNT